MRLVLSAAHCRQFESWPALNALSRENESLSLVVGWYSSVGKRNCFSARGLIAADGLSQVVGLGVLGLGGEGLGVWASMRTASG